MKYIILLILILYIQACSTIQQLQNLVVSTNNYFRVENFPKQIESTLIGTFSDSQIEYTVEFPIQNVWKSALRTSKKIETLTQSKAAGLSLPSLRPVVVVDEEKYIIQNGKVEDAGEIGRINYVGYSSNKKGWADEIIIQLSANSNKETKILVRRNLFEGEPVVIDNYGTSFKDKLIKRTSNGNYERWVITQIEDDLKGKLKRETIAVKKLKPISHPIINLTYQPYRTNNTSKYTISKVITSLKLNGYLYSDYSQLKLFLKNLNQESYENINFVLNELTNSFDKSIDEIINAKGITILKQFNDIDKMNYPDREAVPLIMAANINLTLVEIYHPNQKPKIEIKNGIEQDTIMPMSLYGKLRLSGNIELLFFEPFSKEKMWSNTYQIQMSENEFSYKFQINQDEYYGGELSSDNIVYGEDMRANLLTQAIKQEFTKIQTIIYDSINLSEFINTVESAKKLRDKRKY
ncbi:MAG: hypothetical protein FJW56_10080 [Actinobacteria bacterium]|nr:hypothetical protein [Actinomycetota bacterium]